MRAEGGSRFQRASLSNHLSPTTKLKSVIHRLPPSRGLLRAGAFLALTCCLRPCADAQSKRKSSPPPAKSSGDLTEGLGVTAGASLPAVVAKIDGAPVPREELERTLTALLSANGRRPEELSAEDRKRAYRSVLDEMTADRLVARAAKDEKVEDVEVEKRFDAVKQGFSTEAAFTEELKKTAQTVEKAKSALRGQLRQEQWTARQVADQIKVDPAEAEKFYKENPDRFQLPEMVRASHILLAARRDAPPEVVLEKETKAADLVARLKKGEPFEDLAKQFSDDPNAKQTGGDLDFFGRERIMPEFADAAFKLKVGEVSAPVRTQFGFHLIKLTDHRDARMATLEESRSQILDFLREAKRRQAVSDLLTTLRANAKVEVFLP